MPRPPAPFPRRRPVRAGVAALAVGVAAGGLAGCGRPDLGSAAGKGDKAVQRPEATAHDPLRAQVARVVDGDTLDARLGDGTIQRVRLIGIDTPEKFTTRTGHVECGGEDASRAALQLARRWKAVTLRPDRTQDAYDDYGRLLAYVEPHASPGTTYQQAMLSAGWAEVYVYDHHPFMRVKAFRVAAAQARNAGRGVWQSCGGAFRRSLDG